MIGGVIQMRVENVPIDMSSEQKEILGILSKRQLMYLAGGGIVLYTYVPFVFKFIYAISGEAVAAIIITMFTAVPVLLIVGFFGFMKKQKFNMNNDYYYWISLQRKTQYGSWRKGRD